MTGSSIVHPLGKLDRQPGNISWQDIPYPRYEAERFFRGVLTASVVEAVLVGVGTLVWKLILR
jgi:hypothetical protein